MNHAKLCLCFVLVVLTVNLIECRGGHGGHGGSHGGSHGHSSHSSHGSHSSHSSGGGWFSGWFSGGSKSSGSGSHTYPASTGYSGHGSGGSHTYPNSHGLSGSGGSYYSSYRPSRPTYYTAPQYVYVTHYRETPHSPYSNLLTGLTMYNLGRSHHYHNHYYNDDYQRSGNSGGYYNHHSNTGSEWQNNNAAGTNDEAKCVLKIQKNGKLEVISIPCAIVSTFDNGNHTSNDAAKETTGINNCTSAVNMNMKYIDINSTFVNNTVVNPCVNQTVDIKDPLSVTGAPIAEATDMHCSVEIRTKQDVIQNYVDCNTLLKYAKMAVPEDKTTKVLPPREALKTMLNKPPWWASLLIAV